MKEIVNKYLEDMYGEGKCVSLGILVIGICITFAITGSMIKNVFTSEVTKQYQTCMSRTASTAKDCEKLLEAK